MYTYKLDALRNDEQWVVLGTGVTLDEAHKLMVQNEHDHYKFVLTLE